MVLIYRREVFIVQKFAKVWLLILYEIKKENIFEQNKFVINRDDGLAVVKSKSSQIIERLSKRLRKVFNIFDLKITIDFNFLRTEFLNLELDLYNDTYAPYRKPNF